MCYTNKQLEWLYSACNVCHGWMTLPCIMYISQIFLTLYSPVNIQRKQRSADSFSLLFLLVLSAVFYREPKPLRAGRLRFCTPTWQVGLGHPSLIGRSVCLEHTHSCPWFCSACALFRAALHCTLMITWWLSLYNYSYTSALLMCLDMCN